jgi:Tubulin binding cofactor C
MLTTFHVAHISDCTVTVVAPLRALRLRRLTRCTILVLAVSGACYVEHCTECKLHIACHQTRIHDTTDTQLYLVRSQYMAPSFIASRTHVPLMRLCRDAGAGRSLSGAMASRLRHCSCQSFLLKQDSNLCTMY